MRWSPAESLYSAPMVDGAAALLTRADLFEGKFDHPLVKVSGSAVAVGGFVA